MVYSVFGNFLAILEEYEARQSPHRNIRRYDIAIADQSRKTDEDVSKKRSLEIKLIFE
ncbi:hypothetical protein DPMN_161383 [Dreissena polymorpha]|uniref:Uncharacterized protein n=1 Tax=Dreissena polymorpha TaxID=45954 RepID=A0A9D4ENU9_DREPO|nr:hypothetical protein DPMN_161383 [Dreissena polymorpha]